MKASFVNMVLDKQAADTLWEEGTLTEPFAEDINCLDRNFSREKKLFLNQGSYRAHYKNRCEPGPGTKAVPLPSSLKKNIPKPRAKPWKSQAEL